MFAITVGTGEHRIRIEPIDVMVFNSGQGGRDEGLLVARRHHPGIGRGHPEARWVARPA